MSEKHVLIVTKSLNHEGGVSNYYKIFFNNFKDNNIKIIHHKIGSRPVFFYHILVAKILYPFFFIYDITNLLIRLLLNPKIKIVQFSPSLIPVSLIRDFFLIIVAKMCNRKVIVFFRGWRVTTFDLIKRKKKLKMIFNYVFQNNTYQIVLAKKFMKNLKALYPNKNSKITVAKTLIEKKNIILNEETGNDKINVLFLARLEYQKGVDELIEAICLLKKENMLDLFKFNLAGHIGRHQKVNDYLSHLKRNLDKNSVRNVKFLGRIDGKEKYKLFSKNDIYILPSHSEGCPNSLLEALASGLFCVVSDVGAMPDVINSSNGIVIPKESPSSINDALIYVYRNQHLLKNRKQISKLAVELYDINEVVNFFKKFYKNV